MKLFNKELQELEQAWERIKNGDIMNVPSHYNITSDDIIKMREFFTFKARLKPVFKIARRSYYHREDVKRLVDYLVDLGVDAGYETDTRFIGTPQKHVEYGHALYIDRNGFDSNPTLYRWYVYESHVCTSCGAQCEPPGFTCSSCAMQQSYEKFSPVI